MFTASVLRSSGDNYIYVVCTQKTACVIDPTESQPVIDLLNEKKLDLSKILITHHHADHTGGIPELKEKYDCEVISSNEGIEQTDRIVEDTDKIQLDGIEFRVVATPGHTKRSICFYIPPQAENSFGMVFTGDTLFIGGCGRPIECDAGILWSSLQKIVALGDTILVYCGHDYTEENYRFALTVDPSNDAFRRRLEEVQVLSHKGLPTVGNPLKNEKRTNIFLRANDPYIKRLLKLEGAEDVIVFTELRRRKNNF
ncbi:MAG: hydroxyacylglutathione hydrolase [Candidatus Omnitrophica bacterium]|nr:hydroxyacylglutathione hydrolase [Candidatus Omnitrophota bacterium]